jgi:outer membrane usher protein
MAGSRSIACRVKAVAIARFFASPIPESRHPPRQLKPSICLLLFVALELQAQPGTPAALPANPTLPVPDSRQSGADVVKANTHAKPAVLLLEIRVNGLSLSGITRAERMIGGRLVLPAETWTEARLEPAGDTIALSDGTSGYALEAAPGIVYSIDTSRLLLDITAPAAAFEATAQSLGGRLPLSSGPRRLGVYVTYDATYTRLEDSGPSFGSLVEGVAFGPGGALVSDVVIRHDDVQKEVIRTDTYWRTDLPGRMETLVVGDTISSSVPWSRPVRYGGIRYARDFSLAPGYLPYPIPSIAGSAALPSTVDVLINNQRGATSNVPPGPFELTNVPIVSGAGQIQLVVRDLLGRETVINQSYYLAPVLLAKGVSDFSFEVGSLRENYGTRSDDYGSGFGAGTYRLGITDLLTADLRAEAQRDRGAAGADIAVVVGEFAVVSFAMGYAISAGERGGHYVASIERTTRQGGASVSIEHFDAGYRQFGDTDPPIRPRDPTTTPDAIQLGTIANEPRPRDQIAAQGGIAIGLKMTVGMSFTEQTTWDGDLFSLVGANLGVQLPRNIYLGVYASKELNAGKTWSGGVTMNVPISRRRSAAASSARDAGGQLVNTVQATQTVPSGPGWGWHVAASDDPTQRLLASTAYNGTYGQLTAEANAGSRANGVRLGANGSLEWMDGYAFASRPIDEGAFAVVHVADVGGVPVFLSNQVVAITDNRGIALVTGLLPYQLNALTLDPEQLPLDVEIGGVRETVVPYARSGAFVNFPVKRSRDASVVLQQPNGVAVPAGALVTVTPGQQQFIVAMRGELYLTGLAKDNRIDVRWKDGGCVLTISVPTSPASNDAPRMKPLTCGAAK